MLTRCLLNSRKRMRIHFEFCKSLRARVVSWEGYDFRQRRNWHSRQGDSRARAVRWEGDGFSLKQEDNT